MGGTRQKPAPRQAEPKVRLLGLEDVILKADGTWALKPASKVFVLDQDDWIAPLEAAQILKISRRQVYDWLGDLLVYFRPTPSRPLVSSTSVQELEAARRDPAFGKDPARMAAIRKRVEGKMRSMAELSPRAV